MPRTQAQRTAHTQEALLDATVACLVEVGYANTTTRMVADRAGVSRGAQTHHYPGKIDLVVAAVEHLFDVEATRFVERFGALPPRKQDLDHGISLLWEVVSGPTYAAILELIVAGRTDPELQAVVHQVSARLERTVVELLQEQFPDFADDHLARTIIAVGFTLVQGAAVASYAGYGDPDRTIRLMRALSHLVTPEAAPIMKGVLDALKV